MATKIPYDQGSGLLRVVRSDSSYDEAYCTSIELNIILQDSEVRVFEVKSFGYTILRVDEDLIIDLGAFTDYASVQAAYDDVYAVLLAMLAGIGGGGTGDVTTSGTVLDEEIVIYDGTTGDSIKSSGYTIAQLLALIFDGAIEVNAATTANLAAFTYNNGAAGVGATITMNAVGAFPNQDGVAMNTVGKKLLVKNAANAAHRGVYEMTTAGTGGVAAVWTRMTNSDSAGELYPQVVIVAAGTVNKSKVFVQTNAALATIGTDAITYGTAPAPNLTGYVKRDGTVDFIGTETWDFGGTDTTTIADTGINISDASDSMNVNKTSLIFNDISNTGSMSKSGVGFSDTAGNATQMGVSSFKITQAVTNAESEKKFIKVSLSAAQIQNGNTTPIDVIADPGGGKVIDLISCVAVNNFGTQAFSNTQIHLDCGGGNGEGLLYSTTVFVNVTVTTIAKLYPNTSSSDNAIMTSNAPVKAMFDGDSVGFGDGTIDLYIEYNIITL